jgi:hypothetical protein
MKERNAGDATTTTEHHPDIPLESLMVKMSASGTCLTHAQRDHWARDNLLSRVQVALNTPFGKDCIAHSFLAAVELQHLLLLAFKSSYLSVTEKPQELASCFAFGQVAKPVTPVIWWT